MQNVKLADIAEIYDTLMMKASNAMSLFKDQFKATAGWTTLKT